MAENNASVLGGVVAGSGSPPPAPTPPSPPIDLSSTYTTSQSGRVHTSAPASIPVEQPAEGVDTGPEGVSAPVKEETQPESSSHTFWGRVKDFSSMPSDQYFAKYDADDQQTHDKVKNFTENLVPFAKQFGQTLDQFEKTKIGGQIKEFAEEQLAHPEQLAMGGGFGAMGAVESEGAGAIKGALEKGTQSVGEALSQLPGVVPVAPEGSPHSVKTTAEGPSWERTVRGKILNESAGSVGYKVDPQGTARVYGAVVPDNMRGQGVGTELYRSMVEDARAQGAREITSDPTNTTPAALRVWEKLGEKHGYKVEPITHADGKPGYRIGFPENEPKATPQETPKHEYENAGAEQGVQFRGIQKGIEGAHPGLAIFQDPQSGTSVAVRLDKWSPEKLKEHVVAARERMSKGNPPDVK